MLDWLKSLFGKQPTLLVVIPVAADFPSADELEIRNRITDELESQGLGSFVGSGGGFGTMDFEYEIADIEVAGKMVAKVMQKHMPDAKYKMSVA